MGVNWTNTFAGGNGTKPLKADAARANIEFYNINTKHVVVFKGFLTAFSDTYNVNFNEEAAYGRMDPFRIYQNTVRSMSLTWDIPAWDSDEALVNLSAASELTKMLYPSYVGKKQSAINGSPIIRLKFANLIQRGTGGGTVHTNGLAGYIPNLSITPSVDNGYFEDRTGMGAKGLKLYPKLLQMNCSFNVIHEESLGHNSEGWRGDKSYPYNVTEEMVNGTTFSSGDDGEDNFVAAGGSIAGQTGPPVEEDPRSAPTDVPSSSQEAAAMADALSSRA